MTVTKNRDVVVVGGGQAGLAIGYYLARQGRDFTILEAAAEPAAAWRERWDSLKLFTSARYDSLPGLPFPGDPRRYWRHKAAKAARPKDAAISTPLCPLSARARMVASFMPLCLRCRFSWQRPRADTARSG
jgi:cation diffusion facilitator CzcD-associated flavoprotein CzcO